MLPNAASLLLSETCNLSCKYCFVKKRSPKMMSKEVAKQSIDFLINNAIKEKQNHISVLLFGGEPLLNLDVLGYVLDYGYETCKKNNINFKAQIVTNGTVMNEKIKEILSKYIKLINFGTQLSIDGIKKSHDMYRVTNEGKGSFDLIKDNIKEWKDLYKDATGLLSIHGCLNSNNLKYLYESYLFFRETWDVENLWFMPIHSEKWKKTDVELYYSELNKIADYILENIRKTQNLKELQYYAPLDRSLNNTNSFCTPCGAGKNFVTITALGQISPCHQFYFNDFENYTIIGDIWNGIDEQKRYYFLYYDANDLNCKTINPDCDAFHCYRCIADNYVHNGNMFNVIQGIRCEMSQKENQIQKRIRKEVEKMGLLNQDLLASPGNNPDNPACLCDLGGGLNENVNNIEEYSKNCNCKNTDNEEIIAEALKNIIEQNKYIKFLLESIIKEKL